MSGPLHTVHVRVNDAATGQPTPCRIRFTDAEGNYYAPFGRLTNFSTGCAQDVGGNLLVGQEKYAYIDGSCEIGLPAGQITIVASKGPEYEPIRKELTLTPGKMAVRLEIKRWTDPRQQGWYSGDVLARFLSPHAALLEGAAEDLAVVNLLAYEYEDWHPTVEAFFAVPQEDCDPLFAEPTPGLRRHKHISNIAAFSGQRPALEIPGHMVAVNTLNEHAFLGQLAMLNCHRVVYPLRFGSPDGLDNWTLADWCDQCHRKGGLVVGVNVLVRPTNHHHEILADCVLGKVDALSVTDQLDEPQRAGLALWMALLNCSFRIPLVGGSGKVSNQDMLGGTRTYAQLRPQEEFNYKNWIEAIRAGRTFVTTGPLLSFQVNGQGPGTVIDLPNRDQTVRVRAEARSLAELERLQVILNGSPAGEVEVAGCPSSAVLEVDVPMPTSGWLAARCRGPYSWQRFSEVAAQTSPVYVQIEGRPIRPDRLTVAALLSDLDHMLDWAAHEAKCETDQQRDRLLGIFQAAREELLRRARNGT